MLAHDVLGDGPPVVLLHGFAQHRRCWAPLDSHLAGRHRVVRIDLPGHGDSASIHASVEDGARMAAEVVASISDDHGPAAVTGYSMGARHALRLALDHPALVARLVLISGTAGIDDPAQRTARRTADHERADAVERVGGAAFVADWVADPPFVRTAPDPSPDLRAGAADTAGLAASLRLAGTGSMEPMWDRLGELAAPVLVVAGEHDRTYLELAERMGTHLPHGRVAVVAGAGHPAHTDRPTEVAELIAAFLSEG